MSSARMSADEAWANPETRKLYVQLVIGLLFGTAFEFYDFAVYSQLGKYVGPNFFPAGNLYAEQLSFWAAYAVAFVVRPLGAILFGHCGDRHSRKTSLVYSLLLMAVPTTLMGCLPTFQHISWAAPVLLILLRLGQGLAIGGENGTALVYLYEIAPTKWRCSVVAFGWSGVPFGIFLGIAVVLILQEALSPAAMMLFGWRIAFLLGAATGVVGVLLRRRMPDPALFLQRKHQIEEQLGVTDGRDIEGHSKDADISTKSVASTGSKDLTMRIEEPFPAAKDASIDATCTGSAAGSLPAVHVTGGKKFFPVLQMLRFYWLPVLLQWTWEFWFAAAFYCYTSYMPGFLATNVPGMSRGLALGSTLVHLVGVMLVAWVTGFLCDKGMPRMVTSGIVFIVAGASLAPAAIGMRAGGVAAAWLLHLWFLLLVGVVGGLLAVSMCPLYPPEVRTTGMNFAHQMAVGPIGGITPVILAAIKTVNGDVFLTIVPWLGACAGVSLIAAVALYYMRPEANKDTKQA
uniref:Major facilitator superfamily (MFS) profile domain-containing protein n=1 Tax=Tetradesmus obliquus TaxID=3088 RepID=A0A383V7P2_TETOB|eukprot:jgi/Sobl393_1/3484/SZX60973.1